MLLSLSQLDQHRATPPATGYPNNIRSLFAPIDNVKAALTDLLNSATVSIHVAMYAFDDPELATILKSKIATLGAQVQVTLDRSQSQGDGERSILDLEHLPQANVRIGNSEQSAIMHLKLLVIDGLDTITGSTNWSASAEHAQDNHLCVIRDPVIAAEAIDRCNAIHEWMNTHPPRTPSHH